MVREKQCYVLESIGFLRDVLDLDSQPTYDIIDEYDTKEIETKQFPLTYHVDDKTESIYLINIEESYRHHRNMGSA